MSEMMRRNHHWRIGEIADLLGLSADTLRYYEKIGLLRPGRDSSGQRSYSEKDQERLRFVQRAQAMKFSLNEISQLLDFRNNPRQAKPAVRQLAAQKLSEISAQLQQLDHLQRELSLLVSLCKGDSDSCPIIAGIEQGEPPNE